MYRGCLKREKGQSIDILFKGLQVGYIRKTQCALEPITKVRSVLDVQPTGNPHNQILEVICP